MKQKEKKQLYRIWIWHKEQKKYLPSRFIGELEFIRFWQKTWENITITLKTNGNEIPN